MSDALNGGKQSMSLSLHNYNIVRVSDGKQITNCTIVRMCHAHVVVKYEGRKYKIPYNLIDKVVGHELLMPEE